MKCPKCGYEGIEGKFCGKCGTRIVASGTIEQKGIGIQYCSNPDCRKPLTPGKKFCGFCGTPVSSVQSQTQSSIEVAVSSGYVCWNILPGQLACRFTQKDFEDYGNIKGFIVQDGVKAIFFADGVLAGELTGGRYDFKDMGAEAGDGAIDSVRKFGARIASFFTGKKYDILNRAVSLTVVLVRSVDFPLIFTVDNVPTKGVRSTAAIHLVAEITNIVEFYRSMLLDAKFVSFEHIAKSLEEGVRAVLEEKLNGVDADSISTESALKENILQSLNLQMQSLYPFFNIKAILRITVANAELEELRRRSEELYISEKELEELTRRNDFLNRLNSEKNGQLLKEAQSEADFAQVMIKIDQQNLLTDDEKAKFSDMLYWQRKLREAQSADEGNTALSKLEHNGLLREEELAVLKADIEQRRNLKNLEDGQAVAMLTLHNNVALDDEKLKWEINIGNKRIENELNRQRMQDQYADERRRKEMEFDKEEMQNQMELLRQAQALRNDKENEDFRRRMEETNAQRQHEITMTEMSQKHQEEMRRMFQNMTAEQIMAANPDITPEAAAALAEKFKSQNSEAQMQLVAEHAKDIERIMAANSAQQQENLTSMMNMMGQFFGAQNSRKDAEIDAIRKDSNEHQDRMKDIIKTQAEAAYGAAGKIFVPSKTGSNDRPQNFNRDRERDRNHKDVRVCPSCGAVVPDDQSFCEECGTSCSDK